MLTQAATPVVFVLGKTISQGSDKR